MKKIILAGLFVLTTLLFTVGVRTVLAHSPAPHNICNSAGNCVLSSGNSPHPNDCTSNSECPDPPTPTSSCKTNGSFCSGGGGACCSGFCCGQGENANQCSNPNNCNPWPTPTPIPDCRQEGGQCGTQNFCCPGQQLICVGGPPGTCQIDTTCRGLDDSCGSLNACCSPFVCENNKCVSSGSGSGYRTCGNYDADACLEWSNSPVACPVGVSCSGGVCGGAPTPPGGGTPPPTPTGGAGAGGWIQLKDSSFAGLSSVNNVIPTNVPASNRYFITDSDTTGSLFDPGEAVSPGTLDLGGAPVSTKGWIRAGSSFIPSTSVSSYLSYIKARKGITDPVTSYAQTTNGLYLVQSNSSTSTISSANYPSQFPLSGAGSRRVFVIDGDLTINPSSGVFGSVTSRYAFLITGNLTIDPDVTILYGLFIVQGVVNTGSDNQALTVNGNLITQGTLVNLRELARTDIPSLVINFDPNYYIDLLPYLSLEVYDWRQLL